MLVVIAVAVLIAPASAGAARPAQRLYLALPDSYASGVGASAPSQNGYAALLSQTLRHPGPRRIGQLRNVAVPGATTISILGYQPDEAVKAIEDPATDPRVVTLRSAATTDRRPRHPRSAPCFEDRPHVGSQPTVRACRGTAARWGVWGARLRG